MNVPSGLSIDGQITEEKNQSVETFCASTNPDYILLILTKTKTKFILFSISKIFLHILPLQNIFFFHWVIWTYYDYGKSFYERFIMKKKNNCEIWKESLKQDWVAFMSQPYWVEVKVEVELRLILRLRLIWCWGWSEVEMSLSGSLVEIELRLSWVGVEIS